MNIGSAQFWQDENGRWIMTGKLATLAQSFSFSARPAERASDHPDAPTHELLTMAASGDKVQIGLGWRRALERGEWAGHPMWSLTFDDPSFDQPLYCAAFPRERRQGENGRDLYDAEVVWRRKRGGTKPTQTDAARAPDGPAGPDDEIPY